MPRRVGDVAGLGAGVVEGVVALGRGRHRDPELHPERAQQRPPLRRARREEDHRRAATELGEVQRQLPRGRLGAVGAVDHVLTHLERVVAADGPGGRVERVGRADQRAQGHDRALALDGHHGPPDPRR